MKRFIWAWALLLAMVFGSNLSVAAPPEAPPGFTKLVQRVSPAVVNIDVVRRVRQRMFEWFGEASEPSTTVQRGVGSGFVIERTGLIVTNHHVVAGKPDLTITLGNGRTLHGKVIGSDPLTDVALVRVQASNMAALLLGNSDRAQVGEWVLAFGSPLGLRRTVTAGIISSTNREVSFNERIGFLQTDAAINPGNSGGPLVNMAGQVIGINTAIAAEAQGIGFAIPINSLKLILNELKTTGHVSRAWLGISFAEITPELQENFPELRGKRGLVVAQVVPGGPAARAGVRVEDLLIAIDGATLVTTRDLIAAMARRHPGDRVILQVQRDGKQLQFPLQLQTMPPSVATPPQPEEP